MNSTCVLAATIFLIDTVGALTVPGAADKRPGPVEGYVVDAGKTSTYTAHSKQFSISTPRGWVFRDGYGAGEGIWLGEPQVGGWAGPKTWDPQFMVLKNPLELHKRKTDGRIHLGANGDLKLLAVGDVGGRSYEVWSEGGWAYADCYVESGKCIWQIEVHIPKSSWRHQLPVALKIIQSFRLQNEVAAWASEAKTGPR